MTKVVQLKDIATIMTGNTPKTSDVENYNSNDICFIKPSDISESEIVELSESEFYISESARNNARLAPQGSILVTCIGIIGKTAILKSECAFNQQINAVIPDTNLVDTHYLAYAIANKKDHMQETANAAVVPIINKSEFSKMSIILPSLKEQQRIANILEKIRAVISLRKQQFVKLDELVKARFVEMFGDPITNCRCLPTKQLGKICNLKAGTTTSADEIHEFSKEYPIPCYGGNGIRGYVKESTQHGLYPIIGRQGALCGNLQLANGNFHATEHAVLVTPIIEMDTMWLFYLLKYMDLYRFHTGAAQPGLAVKTLNEVPIPIATITLQRDFSVFSKQIDRQKLTIQQSLAKLEVLKKALMQEYFG
ncbi:MAG: restriction endonuclease subunit S [Oscillibacter sp.]|nr:restriction endonuclease subunit S [Oscillibacter sp.]